MLKKALYPNKLLLALNIIFAVILLVSVIGLITISCLPVFGFDYLNEDKTNVYRWTETTQHNIYPWGYIPERTVNTIFTQKYVAYPDIEGFAEVYKVPHTITPYQIIRYIPNNGTAMAGETIVLTSPVRYNIFISFIALLVIAILYIVIYLICYLKRKSIASLLAKINDKLNQPRPPKPPRKPTNAERIAELERQVSELSKLTKMSE